MTPVRQTITGNEFANCLQAAVASFFDLELERVPNFLLFGEKWWDALYWFIWSIGFELLGYVDGLPPEDGQYYIVHLDFGNKDILKQTRSCILDKDLFHSVIWKDGEIVHDPHTLVKTDVKYIKGYYKIVLREKPLIEDEK